MPVTPSPRSLADLGEVWREHPVLRAEYPRYRDVLAWGGRSALVLSVQAGEPGSRALVGLGGPEPLATLVADVLDPAGAVPVTERLGPRGPAVVSLTRGAWARLPETVRTTLALPRVSHWDWMVSTAVPPAHPQEHLVTELDPATDRPAMEALQTAALPHSYTSLDEPATRWFGWRDAQGVLRCMAAAGVREAEVHLGSIATHPDFRRRGLATAVTAAATRIGLASSGQVSLALYADNLQARRVYERLGFTLVQEWESRRPALPSVH